MSTPSFLVPVAERLPDNSFGFVWVKCASRDDLIMAYFTDRKFQYAETVGDREGLSVEYHEDVTHWAEIITPEIKSQPLKANL